MEYITITGSHGELTVNAETGYVLVYHPENEPEEYSEIIRFDLKEFKSKYGEVRDGDILDFGYWTKSGHYEPPCSFWRDVDFKEFSFDLSDEFFRRTGMKLEEHMNENITRGFYDSGFRPDQVVDGFIDKHGLVDIEYEMKSVSMASVKQS